MIYTSYFAQLKKIGKANGYAVSIAKWNPKWYTGDTCAWLQPDASLLIHYKEGAINEDEYRKQFLDDLSRMDPEPIIDELKEAAGDRDIYLLCYEKPSDFCHRHIVAEWLKQNNIECEEKVW